MRGIYAITDESLLAGKDLESAVRATLEAGICLLQYRSKSLPVETRLQQARLLQQCCQEFNVPLLINDDVQLCLETGAAGVHLGQGDTDLAAARSRLGAEAIIGISCHDSVEAALQAQSGSADYVAFGRFFPSSTKPQATPADPGVLERAKSQISIPLVAIGGINPENGAALVEAGADMLAVIHSIFAADDIYRQTRRLVALYEDR